MPRTDANEERICASAPSIDRPRIHRPAPEPSHCSPLSPLRHSVRLVPLLGPSRSRSPLAPSSRLRSSADIARPRKCVGRPSPQAAIPHPEPVRTFLRARRQGEECLLRSLLPSGSNTELLDYTTLDEWRIPGPLDAKAGPCRLSRPRTAGGRRHSSLLLPPHYPPKFPRRGGARACGQS